MNIVIMQPYFLPHIGYFQLIASADIFVSLDDVNFINRGWINRNSLCFNGKRAVFSLPLCKASQNKLINEIEISGEFNSWRNKFFRSLQSWYGKQEFFDEGMEFAETVLSPPHSKIASINFESLRLASKKLGLKAVFYRASELNIPRTKGASRLLAIARHFNTDTYVNAPGGKSLYCDAMFEPYGVNLRFLKARLHEYPMPEWIPSLSVLDAIMRLGFSQVGEKLIPGWGLERGKRDFAISATLQEEEAMA